MKKPLIATTPNPIIYKPTKKVSSFDDELKKDAEVLKKVLRQYSDNGIGLAANQIGIDKSIFVTEYINDKGKTEIPLQFFVNPQIIEKSEEKETIDEGCLSIPDIYLPVERSNKIKVKAQDLNGRKIKLTTKGLFARLIQHESDHLSGKVFTEYVKTELLKKNPELKKLKIVFIGSGDFAEIICRGLILLGLDITMVISEKAKPSGRSKELRQTPVALTALEYEKKLIETENIGELSKTISDVSPDLIILADFGQIIPKSILDIPTISAINLHPSILPKYRGSTPIQTAILSGDKETGLSIIEMSPEIDKGKIIGQKTIEILADDNSYSLEIRLANLGLKTLMEVLPKLQSGDIEEITQDESRVIKTKKFSKAQGEIDWKKSAIDIERQIRAFYPWPGSFTDISGSRFIIHQAHLEEGKLILDVVQPEGRKAMMFSDFLKGFRGIRPAWFAKVSLEKMTKIR